MLREAVRRVLWLIPALGLVTLTAFWMLSSARLGGGPGAEVPRFFNPNPRDAADRARDAADRIARGAPDAEDAARELREMGGAALPHVLPRLDALAPDERVRVALSLSPIARRMGLGRQDELERRDTVVLFWTRFWQDHAIDFRPAVARRAVRRAALHPSTLRKSEVLQLDTYALAEILDAMGVAIRDGDAVALATLTDLAADITGNSWTVGPSATAAQQNAVAGQWRRFWGRNRRRYVSFQGIDRLVGVVRETQYGRWASQLGRSGFGPLDDERTVLDALLSGGRVTLTLVAASLLGSYSLGVALAWIAAIRRRIVDPILSLTMGALLALPATVFGLLFATGMPGAVLVMGVLGAAVVFFHQRGALAAALERACFTASRAFGLAPARVARDALRLAVYRCVGLATANFSLVLTAAFVVEHAAGLSGLGHITVDAVHRGHLGWLMGIVVVGAAGAGLLQIASDLVLQRLDPRVDPQLAPDGGTR